MNLWIISNSWEHKNEKTFTIASALIFNFNFVVNRKYEEVNPSVIYYYAGIGPTMIQVSKMEAAAVLADGTAREVSASYTRVGGIALQMGVKSVVFGSKSVDGQLNFGGRLGIPFGDMPFDKLTVKENGTSVNTDKNDIRTVRPTYFMFFLSFDIGWK